MSAKTLERLQVAELVVPVDQGVIRCAQQLEDAPYAGERDQRLVFVGRHAAAGFPIDANKLAGGYTVQDVVAVLAEFPHCVREVGCGPVDVRLLPVDESHDSVLANEDVAAEDVAVDRRGPQIFGGERFNRSKSPFARVVELGPPCRELSRPRPRRWTDLGEIATGVDRRPEVSEPDAPGSRPNLDLSGGMVQRSECLRRRGAVEPRLRGPGIDEGHDHDRVASLHEERGLVERPKWGDNEA